MFHGLAENSLAAPFKCPLTKCQENISHSLLLSHFLKVHQREEESVDFKEIEENEAVSMIVTVTGDYLELDKNVCLGVLAYKMDHSKHSNALLSVDYAEFSDHLPILVMACRSNYVKMFEDDCDYIDPDADFLNVWLLMPEVMKKQKLYSTITVHDLNVTKSLSKLVQIRNANDSQDVSKFMDSEINFLTISSGFLQKISDNETVFIEILVKENLI